MTRPRFEVRFRNRAGGEQRILTAAFSGVDVYEEQDENAGADHQHCGHQQEVVVGGEDPHDDYYKTSSGEGRAEGVEGMGRIGFDWIDDRTAQVDDYGDDDRLEDERGPPADRCGDESADQWAGGGSDAAHAGDHTERPGA